MTSPVEKAPRSARFLNHEMEYALERLCEARWMPLPYKNDIEVIIKWCREQGALLDADHGTEPPKEDKLTAIKREVNNAWATLQHYKIADPVSSIERARGILERASAIASDIPVPPFPDRREEAAPQDSETQSQGRMVDAGAAPEREDADAIVLLQAVIRAFELDPPLRGNLDRALAFIKAERAAREKEHQRQLEVVVRDCRAAEARIEKARDLLRMQCTHAWDETIPCKCYLHQCARILKGEASDA